MWFQMMFTAFTQVYKVPWYISVRLHYFSACIHLYKLEINYEYIFAVNLLSETNMYYFWNYTRVVIVLNFHDGNIVALQVRNLRVQAK